MLALTLTLSVLAAPPRGLPAVHSMELVAGVEAHLPAWLAGKELDPVLATRPELEKYFGSRVAPADLKTVVKAALDEQHAAPVTEPFVATRVLLTYDEQTATVHLFDAQNRRCTVPLLQVGPKTSPRYVLLGAPSLDSRSLDAVVDGAKATEAMQVYAEKKDGTWLTGPRPAPPPPDCGAVMKQALKTIFTAEKSYFAEFDAYSSSLSKVGVDVKSLGVTAAKVSVSGAAPKQTFVIQVGLKGGVMQMNDSGELTVVGECAR